MPATTLPLIDITGPEFDPPDCPAWAKESVPTEILPYRGRNGLPAPYRERSQAPLAMNVRGLDRYQANQFIVYRPETATFLYTDYTPTEVGYRNGLLPSFEALAEEVAGHLNSPAERALALLTQGVSRVKHPCMPPCGPPVADNRNLDDEALLQSGRGWCNEQARVFVRLCQVSGIPARIIQLFYSDLKTGHCIAEFHADGQWAMADASWFCAFPGPDGKLLSAVECHDGGEGQAHCGKAYYERIRQLLRLSDEELNFSEPGKAAEWRKKHEAMTAADYDRKMNCFAIINYPLPRQPGES